MSRYAKNNPLLLLMALLVAPVAEAVIEIDKGNPAPPPAFANRAAGGIILMPPAQTEAGRLIQRSQAWRNYNASRPASGAWLVYPTAGAGAYVLPMPGRQSAVQNNISRAQAYRLDYYKR